MLTNDYSRYWTGENGATVTVQSTDNTPLQGVYLNFFGKAPCIQVFETGSDETIAEFTAGYENAWIPFSRSVSGFYLKARDNETLKISGISDDIKATVRCVEQLGARVEISGENVTVVPPLKIPEKIGKCRRLEISLNEFRELLKK